MTQISKKPKVIVVVGPTASGKSDLAIKLAQKLNGEIISADSRQVYRGMDIGTGKVTKTEQKLVKHYLLDVADPKKIFTAVGFKRLAEKAIGEILKKGKVPIIVGGTGFYIDVLLGRINPPNVAYNSGLRAKLEKLTAEQLLSKLMKLDPRRAKVIDRYNRRRLIRALEIIDSLGRVPRIVTRSKYRVLWIGLHPGKEKLEKLIKERLEKRFNKGMIAEVRRLIKGGLSQKRLFELGLEYRWISLYLNKKISKAEMKNRLERASIQYAKRQMTWFGRNKEIRWFRFPPEALTLITRTRR